MEIIGLMDTRGDNRQIDDGYRLYSPSGLAHLRFSTRPVLGQRISCQDTGSIVAPKSMM